MVIIKIINQNIKISTGIGRKINIGQIKTNTNTALVKVATKIKIETERESVIKKENQEMKRSPMIKIKSTKVLQVRITKVPVKINIIVQAAAVIVKTKIRKRIKIGIEKKTSTPLHHLVRKINIALSPKIGRNTTVHRLPKRSTIHHLVQRIRIKIGIKNRGIKARNRKTGTNQNYHTQITTEINQR